MDALDSDKGEKAHHITTTVYKVSFICYLISV